MIETLARYRIDRADGMALGGPEKLVILVLKTNESRDERAYAISKADAMLIGMALQSAAIETQAEKS